MLEARIDEMLQCWEERSNSRRYKKDLFDIFEGDLFRFVDADLRETLGASSKSYLYARSRIPPINLLQKLISKLSQIYNTAPMRNILDGSETDQMMLAEYVKLFDVNIQMDVANEFYNMTKISFVMPTYDIERDRFILKVALPHQFLPFGWDPVDRTKMTAIMLLAHENGSEKVFYAYSDDEFIKFNGQGDRLPDEAGGINIYGKIPGAYIRKSRSLLYPMDDTDLKRMTTLIPTMLADLNLASMFSAFSIVYGIDITAADLKFTPNGFWSLQSDPDSDKKPELGTIKPEADIDQTINLIVSQLSMWLNSKGIRPGSVGKITGDNMVSGVSKIVDEMDSFEDRRRQAMVFKAAEERQLWPLIMHHMHPVWISQGLNTNVRFTPSAEVMVEFPEQEALKSRDDKISSLRAEVEAGFLSTRRAISRLNPDMDDDEIDQILSEINDKEEIEIVAEDTDSGGDEPVS